MKLLLILLLLAPSAFAECSYTWAWDYSLEDEQRLTAMGGEFILQQELPYGSGVWVDVATFPPTERTAACAFTGSAWAMRPYRMVAAAGTQRSAPSNVYPLVYPGARFWNFGGATGGSL